jgi:putative transcription factor
LERKENTCEVCGKPIWGRGRKVRIEGVVLQVCADCADLGEQIAPRKRGEFTLPAGRGAPAGSRAPVGPRPGGRSRAPTEPKPDVEDEFTIKKGFGKIIQQIRAGEKLDQPKFAQKIGVKMSLLQKWELEKTEPTIPEAKKLEVMFNVKLLDRKVADEEASITMDDLHKYRASRGASLGDFIKVRKKKE